METCAIIGLSFGAAGVPITAGTRNFDAAPFGRIESIASGCGAGGEHAGASKIARPRNRDSRRTGCYGNSLALLLGARLIVVISTGGVRFCASFSIATAFS